MYKIREMIPVYLYFRLRYTERCRKPPYSHRQAIHDQPIAPDPDNPAYHPGTATIPLSSRLLSAIKTLSAYLHRFIQARPWLTGLGYLGHAIRLRNPSRHRISGQIQPPKPEAPQRELGSISMEFRPPCLSLPRRRHVRLWGHSSFACVEAEGEPAHQSRFLGIGGMV